MMCGAELSKLPDGVQRVVAFLQSSGYSIQPRILDDAARTAQQAADALGVELGQIAKSIIFRRKSDDAAVLVITSGDKRVDETKVERLVCEAGIKLGRADADFVKLKTGFAIGGVAPVAHRTKPVTFLDKELFRFKSVWAAAGHPNAVFEISPAALQILVASTAENVTL
jgi:prolyl-tRNA editing enzyme YbaK/EbsC (Cys-tRNA(Pro) deacylase)